MSRVTKVKSLPAEEITGQIREVAGAGINTLTNIIGGSQAQRLSVARDVQIASSAGDSNYGAYARIVAANTTKSLLWADFSVIPDTVTEIKLYLWNLDLTNSAAGTVNLWGLTTENAGWIEGVGVPTAALTGEPTWNNHSHGVRDWAAGGNGLSSAVVDYRGDLLLGTLTAPVYSGVVGGIAQYLSITLNLTNFQTWLAAEGNAGLMFHGPSPAIFSASSKQGANPPYFEYVAPLIPSEAKYVYLIAEGPEDARFYPSSDAVSTDVYLPIKSTGLIMPAYANGASGFSVSAPVGTKVKYWFEKERV